MSRTMKSRLRTFLLAAVATLTATGALAQLATEGMPQLDLQRTQIGAGMYRIDAQVAATPEQRQIGLMYRGELLLGVSHASAYGETAWARRGGGAFLNGKPIRVAATEQWSQASLSTGNLKTLASGARWSALADLVRGAHRTRGYGDFLHYHLLAAGCIDVVLESDVNILDIAALVAIIREAGGVFTDLEGREIGLNTSSVLAATPALHAQVLARLQSV